MTFDCVPKTSRRTFLRQTGLTTFYLSSGLALQSAAFSRGRSSAGRRKVIVIGIDGMDPVLTERMMDAGKLPTFARLRAQGGYRQLQTSDPPQSPVAWANFINGDGPGSHGIFDFIHRDPAGQCVPYYSAAETTAGRGHLSIGDYRIPLDFWPFNHQPPRTVLNRGGTPFWEYLEGAGIASVFYCLPSNYPPSPSFAGWYRCLAGMGTPDLLGTYGTYQHFSEDGPLRTVEEPGGRHSMLFFENETARAKLIGPPDVFLKDPVPVSVDFLVHRDIRANAAVIDLQGQTILLKSGQWSSWRRVNFALSLPGPDKQLHGLCRFYLQEVFPTFRLYVAPINADPCNPAIPLTEPKTFGRQISKEIGPFYTTGFQEDHKALSNGVFTDEEFAEQAEMVLHERLNLLEYAKRHYEDGLLFFYFSSTDMQAHMFWWDSDEPHPVQSRSRAQKNFAHLQKVYQKMDDVVGEILDEYGSEATVLALSDHGFSNFGRQFNLNSWLRENGYLYPAGATSLMKDVDWSRTRAYGLGINGLYLNLKGRERDGIVSPQERESLLEELIEKLEAVRDENGKPAIRKVRRSDKIYVGSETESAPDLIVGYARGYRASWATCLGDLTRVVFSDNDSAWIADHCCDSSEVPGVLFANRPIRTPHPSLVDLAPSILAQFGLPTPSTMSGRNVL